MMNWTETQTGVLLKLELDYWTETQTGLNSDLPRGIEQRFLETSEN